MERREAARNPGMAQRPCPDFAADDFATGHLGARHRDSGPTRSRRSAQ